MSSTLPILDYSLFHKQNFNTETLRKKLTIIRLLLQSVQYDIYTQKTLEQLLLEELDQSIIRLNNKILAQQWLTYHLLYSGRPNPETTKLQEKITVVETEKVHVKEKSLQNKLELNKEKRKLFREYLETLEHLRLF